ncbi:hypothetical protein MCOR02_006166 [Pyricularia oryzae]|nr:hypothetical protein MCOR02_006166 [Pyricularia oryzae]KAI6306557.1 hypothetical protein MCOR34_007986 [Pyricularia oryzae]KAI6470021.1 hypothetical protein MCOR17_003632 [Pyricularia oryzae]KAI6493802.1 hypothetical protein MCOR13_007710 [Pyricularia oryzae]KAI6590100.1 hypothetical protein MCOR04_003892 [Pyricularia oryzae]
MASTIKIALIQMQSKPLALEHNFCKASTHIRAAASSGCQLAILPEYHLTSWVPDNPRFLSSCAASAAYLERYQALARELNIHIVPGTICEVHSVDAQASPPTDASSPSGIEVRNMAYFLEGGTGRVLGDYQKKNLWHTERPHLTPSGASMPHAAFDVPPSALAPTSTLRPGSPLRVGLLVCWDLSFPEAFRALVADGADLVVVPSWWLMDDAGEAGRLSRGQSERLFLESVPVARAFESCVAVAFCNAGGLSQVAVPLLGALGRTPPVPRSSVEAGLEEEEDVVSVVDLDLEVLRVAEETYLMRRDMNGEGWHYAPGRPGGA